MPKALKKPPAVVSLPLRPEDNKYLRTRDAAHHLGMSPGTLEVFRTKDQGRWPPVRWRSRASVHIAGYCRQISA